MSIILFRIEIFLIKWFITNYFLSFFVLNSAKKEVNQALAIVIVLILLHLNHDFIVMMKQSDIKAIHISIARKI